MDFTNDIKFSRKPTSNELLRVSYYGKLVKENSNELTMVYGFGENWDNTTEQKMEPTIGGFTTKIKVLDSSTLNFCFKNEHNVWDNNNSFNYISGIKPQKIQADTTSTETEENTNTTVEDQKVTEETTNVATIATEEIPQEHPQKIVEASVLEELSNYTELDFGSNEESIQTIATEDSDILDSLLQELFNEYETANNNLIQEVAQTETPSLSINEQIIEESVEDIYANFFSDVEEIAEPSKTEYFDEMTTLFDELINQITVEATQEPEVQTIQEDVELNETISQIVENITLVEEKSNVDVNSLNFDYSDFNEMFAFAQELNETEEKEESIFNFDNKEFDFNGLVQETETKNETVQNTTTVSNTLLSTDNNLNEFEKLLNNYKTVHEVSDSFYDDEDTSIHTINYNFSAIADSAIEELNQEVFENTFESSVDIIEKEQEFEKAINEYANYFDSLIDEIISSSVETTEGTTEEQAVGIESLQVANNKPAEFTNERVADDYALCDMQSFSSVFLFKRRVKLIVSTLFTKLPKLFGKEGNTENN